MRGWLSLDAWLEAVTTLLSRPLRTGLTAVSVGWAVWMLVVLLAAGEGLENGLRYGYRDDAINSIWLSAGTTTQPHAGYKEGRAIALDDDDVAFVRGLPEAGAVTARYYPPSDLRIARGSRVGTFDIRATHPDHQVIEGTQIEAGRFLTDRDLDGRRKVAVLGLGVLDYLFPDEPPPQQVLGEEIRIGGVVFTVVGVFSDEGGEREESIVYLPITTARAAFGGREQVDRLMFTVGPMDIDAASLADAERAMEAVRQGLGAHHGFHPADRGALRVRDLLSDFADVRQVFVWLRGFSWLVGLGTLLAGVVGVGNTLLISVKERRRELGLRKALGARPGDLLGMVLREALLLTSVSGWLGLVLGLGAVEALRRWVPPGETLRDPDVDLVALLIAVGALVASGLVAGLVPAWQAARIAPVEALRDD